MATMLQPSDITWVCQSDHDVPFPVPMLCYATLSQRDVPGGCAVWEAQELQEGSGGKR